MLTHSDIICRDLGIAKRNVESVVRLLEEGATVPFIARYRKEVTGNLDEVAIEEIRVRSEKLSELDKRKQYISEAISAQGVLTDDLQRRINECYDAVELEDIYLPYKPKRRTKASVARERGLEPLAKMIMAQNNVDLSQSARRFVTNEVPDAERAISGASDIIAEWVSESEKARGIVRQMFQRDASVTSKVVKGKETEGAKYENYFDFSEPLRRCSSHRYLAMRRGEEEGFLRVKIGIDDERAIERLKGLFVKRHTRKDLSDVIGDAVADGYKRLLRASIETEIAAEAKKRSDAAAIDIFAHGLRQVLMAPPLGNHRVLAVDPGFRTGCKVVCLDEQGNLLAHDVIYPCEPRNDREGAARTMLRLVDKYKPQDIAVGNGTASHETERFLRGIDLPEDIRIHSVSEQGASIYSASEISREEFPDQDITVRGAVSIGRRLLDPLAELVKIDPRSIGVGQYQHDVNKADLKRALDFTVSSCVNQVGVNVNTASKQLLSYVAGIGETLAANIVAYRAENGAFGSRAEIKRVPRMGDKAYQQCAGFLRVPISKNPLDNSAVHPESYAVVERMSKDVGCKLTDIVGNERTINDIDLTRYVTDRVGLPTLQDIAAELRKPGQDPRVAAEASVNNADVTSIADLKSGMLLSGKVSNVTAFGAFVDIGIKENGLVHVSQLSDRYVSNPLDVVKIGQVVRVRVLDVDESRKRVSLSMKGTDV